MRSLCHFLGGCFVITVLTISSPAPSSALAKGKAKEKPKVALKLKVGDTAPSFEAADDAGQPFKSSDVFGKKIVVLYFYAIDFSGACTAQARAYRDQVELQDKNVLLVGVSGDSVATHKLFKAQHELKYPLLADEKGELAKTYGIPVKKGGKSPTINAKGEKGTAERGVTIERVTVVIDKAGKIAAIDPVSKISDDPKRVADIIKKLDAK